MGLQIELSDEDIKYLNPPAKSELIGDIQKYIDELLKEASRLEAAGKTTVGNPEITSSMVKDAALLLKRGYKRANKGKWQVILQIGASISTLVTGILFDFEKLKEPLMLVAFMLVFSIALTTSILVIIKE